MADDGENKSKRRRSWLRWLLIALGAIVLVLVAFHGPILRAVIHSVAVSYASGQNLKLSFALEGDPVEQVTLRNVHAAPTGPSAVRALDAGLIRVDYSLWDLVFHGISDTLKNVEVHDLRAVIDSSKAPLPTPTPTPSKQQQFNLPRYFPDRVVVRNLSLTIKGKLQDMVIEELNIGLYPDREGKLQVAKVQVPGVDTWTHIQGTTTYANKDLYIHNLTLDQNTHFETVNLNASQIGEGKLGLELKGTLGGGEINTQAEISTAGPAVNANTHLHARDISLGKLAKYAGKSPAQLTGKVRNVDLDFNGNLNQPATWNGSITADLQNLGEGAFRLDRVQLNTDAKNGRATIHEARVDQGNNHVAFRGSIDLPKSTAEFGRTPGSLEFSLDAPDLRSLTAFMTPPASGSLQASGNIKTENNTLQLNAHAAGEQIGYKGAAIEKLVANLTAEKKLALPNEQRKPPIFEGLRSNIQARMNNVRYGNFAIETVQANVQSDGAKVTLSPLIVKDSNNLLQANATFQLPRPDEKLLDQPADLQFNLNAPAIAEFWEPGAPDRITGALAGNGAIQLRKGVAGGRINLSGQQLAARNLVVRQLNLQTAIAHNVLHLQDLTATINGQDYLHAEGEANLQKPYHYSGKATAHLADLSALEPVLNVTKPESAPPATKKLAGSLVLNWKGHGTLKTVTQEGDLNLQLEHGRYADLQNLEARVEAHYSPQQLNVPIVYLGSDKFNLQASIAAQNSKLQVSNLQVSQAATKYAVGYLEVPFTWSNLGTGRPLFPPNGNVQINFQSENLDIAKLSRDLGMTPAATGQVSVTVNARGPLDQLEASLDLKMQNLEAAATHQLQPATITVAARLRNRQLTVDGTITQPKIEPVQISARLPLNVSDVIAAHRVPPQTPLQAKIQMPRSSINFVREFVPALRQLDGSAAFNVNVDGTVAQPALSGAAEMHINVARFDNPTLPALQDFDGQLSFRNNELRIGRFGGNLAGGPFTVSGAIRFSSLTNITLDLRLKANSILVARNDNLTARVDADIAVRGPLTSATVSGQVLTTNSRFFKNIDIIPIALPGRPAPHPEPPSAAPTLSFPNPPLRDWKFDITIKSKEPFLIRGNLATGSAIIDMKVAGTGLHPKLQGQVRLQNFDATLPFSTLTITLGFIYFNPDDPLNPRLELQGTSLIRDYTIHVYVYGTANAPQAVFSSEPPLPQEEIISLLATGTTREELAGGNVLASRAAILLVKQLYRKIFKKGAQPEQNDNSFFSRLDVQFGETDPRTGEQTATARYKVSDNVVLIGDLGVQGSFRGLVKYLIRFR